MSEPPRRRETSPTSPLAPAGPTLRRLGPHVLLQRLGEGGMGEVWLAEQQEPVRRKVALKVAKLATTSPEAVGRFETERQALALMRHPNVATVLDGGMADDGRPWFAMELVQGRPITDWCDEHRLPLRDRLELFLQACAGVQHAHQRGLLHRDLKPSNVLVEAVDGAARVKIIDFGLAKAFGRSLVDGAPETRLGVVMGTLEYMSPEQADPATADVDTRTDVYALGVLLHELVTGTLPFVDPAAGPTDELEVRRRLRQDDPPRPSSRIRETATRERAEARGTTTGAWAHAVAGDLDWILLEALERDRARRYGSVADLAADVRRHLADEPVQAGAPSTPYVIGKFVRRHRWAVAGASSLLAVLVLGLAGTTAGLVQARRERQRALDEAEVATRVSDLLAGIFELSAPEQARGKDLTVRQALARGAERIAVELQDQPEVRARLQLVIGRVHGGLGLLAEARLHLEQAAATRRALLGDEHPDTIDAEVALGRVLRQLEQRDRAKRLLVHAVAVGRAALGPEHETTLAAQAELGRLLRERGELAAAERATVEALEGRRRVLGPDALATRASELELARLHARHGDHVSAGDLARPAFQAILARMGPDHPLTMEARNVLGDALSHLGEHEAAIGRQEENLAALERVLGSGHRATLDTLTDLAEAHDRAGYRASGDEQVAHYDKAESYYLRALDILIREHGEASSETARARADLAALRYRQGRLEEAEALVRAAVRTYAESPGGEPWRVVVNQGLLVHVLRDLGRDEEALELYWQVFEGRTRTQGRLDAETVATLRGIADLERRLGREADAGRTLDRWIDLVRERLGESHPAHLASRAEWHLLREGDTEAALASLERAVDRGWDDFETLTTSPVFDSLRGRERFRRIAARLASPTMAATIPAESRESPGSPQR